MLILIVHGSPAPCWRESVEQLIGQLRAELGHDDVGLAYLGSAPPTLEDVIVEGARGGITRFRVLPLFLSGSGHVARDVGPLVTRLREEYGKIEMELLPPVGQHPLFREMLFKVAREAAETS